MQELFIRIFFFIDDKQVLKQNRDKKKKKELIKKENNNKKKSFNTVLALMSGFAKLKNFEFELLQRKKTSTKQRQAFSAVKLRVRGEEGATLLMDSFAQRGSA